MHMHARHMCRCARGPRPSSTASCLDARGSCVARYRVSLDEAKRDIGSVPAPGDKARGERSEHGVSGEGGEEETAERVTDASELCELGRWNDVVVCYPHSPRAFDRRVSRLLARTLGLDFVEGENCF